MCWQSDEIVKYIVGECLKMPQKVYKQWHDWIGKISQVCSESGFTVKKK